MAEINDFEELGDEIVEEVITTENEVPEVGNESESVEETSAEEATEETSPENNLSLKTLIEGVNAKVDKLQDDFDLKFKVDAHKNQMFDQMHKELTELRNGIAEKNTESMAKDIITLIDTYAGFIETVSEREGDNMFNSIVNNFKNILQDLLDVLYRQDIEPYSKIDEDTLIVDVKYQKIVKVVNTNDPELNNKVCQQLAPGYDRNGKIIRPEKISIYKYKEIGSEE